MKYAVAVTATITLDVEIDTDELEDFADSEEEGLDANDKDAVHDVLVDQFRDEDTLLEFQTNEGFSVGRVDITVEPLTKTKASSK
jgi:hypothetical protein